MRRFQTLLSIFNTRHYNLELKASVEIKNSGMGFLDNLKLSGQYLSDCNGHTVTTIKAVFGADESFDLIPGLLAGPDTSVLSYQLNLSISECIRGMSLVVTGTQLLELS